MYKKRILWICNHVTLMDAEVPLLNSLGSEVYVPKKFPRESEFVSCKASYVYDESLTIPPEDLQILNSVDFYSDRFSPEVIECIRRNFLTAFTSFYENPLKMLLKFFPGRIFIRAFGLAGDASYWNVARCTWGQEFLDNVSRIKSRVYFAAAYENMLEVEQNVFKQQGVFLPLGLPENFAAGLKGKYTGAKKQIFFVCSKICSSPYYHNVYKDFKKHFSDLPHVISGKPFGRLDDPHLLGYLPREEFNQIFCDSRVMYYHSVEPRHLHYHPLEAMYAGQPVIFRTQGMLGELTPDIKYPGAADTIAEARKKLKRVLSGDQAFIQEIQESQKDLLEFFSTKTVLEYWKQNFLPIVEKELPPVAVCRKKEHIGIILPLGYRGGTLHAYTAIANMLAACGYKVTAGIPHDYFEEGELYYPFIEEELKEKLHPEITIRVFNWRPISEVDIFHLRELSIDGREISLSVPYALMDDRINHFCECDRWLFISDRFHKGVPYPLRPYSVIVYDYLQRYLKFQLLPEHLEDIYFTAVRQAQSVFATNAATLEDIINYCGVSRKKTALLPFEFSNREMQKYLSSGRTAPVEKKRYLVWVCNLGIHKNHLNILKGLLKYFSEHDDALDVYVTGENTEKLKPRGDNSSQPAHIRDFQALYKRNRARLSNLHIAGRLDREAYLDLLKGAEFVLLSSSTDNGAFAAVEAAYLGVPTLSCDYPQMRYMDGYYTLNTHWYDGNSVNAIAQALGDLQDNSAAYRQLLPDREVLDMNAYENKKDEIAKMLQGMWI